MEDPDYEAKKNAPKEFKLINPTADESDEVGFISHNANVSIVMDPFDGMDNCYLFVSKNDTKQWIYAIQDVSFTPGKTYKIEYDIALASIGTNTDIPDGTTANSFCNFQYADSSSNNHVVTGTSKPITKDGWTHVTAEYMVSNASQNRSSDRFTIFTNPVNELGAGFYINNVKVTPID